MEHGADGDQHRGKRARCGASQLPEAQLKRLLQALQKQAKQPTVRLLAEGQPASGFPGHNLIPIRTIARHCQLFWQQAANSWAQQQGATQQSKQGEQSKAYPLQPVEVFQHALRAVCPQLHTFLNEEQGECLLIESSYGDHGIADLLLCKPNLFATQHPSGQQMLSKQQQEASSSTSTGTVSHTTLPTVNASILAEGAPAADNANVAIPAAGSPQALGNQAPLEPTGGSSAADDVHTDDALNMQLAVHSKADATSPEVLLLAQTALTGVAGTAYTHDRANASPQPESLQHRHLPDSHVHAVRFMLDVEGQQDKARKMWDRLQRAQCVNDREDFRLLVEKAVHCKHCRRQLSFMCFQRKGEEVDDDNQPQVYCLAHARSSDTVYTIARIDDEELRSTLLSYVEDTRPDLLPPATAGRKRHHQEIVSPLLEYMPASYQATDADIGSNGTHIWHVDDLKDLLCSIGRTFLESGAETVDIKKQKREAYPASDVLAVQIIDALQAHEYFSTNLCVDTTCADNKPNKMSKQVQKWRAEENTFHKAHMSTSKTNTTLVLAGAADTFTDWHVDWSEAINYCLLLVGLEESTTAKDVDQPAAVWWFVRPDSIHLANKFLQDMAAAKAGCAKTSLDKQSEQSMTDGELESMQHYINAHGGQMLRVDQRPGDKVVVPVGWMHIVKNKKACVKVAWDFYDDKRWHLYFLASHHLLTVTGQRNAYDYMDVEAALLATLKVERAKWVQQLLARSGSPSA